MPEVRNHVIDNDPIAEKREERALRNFKQVLREMLYLLMQSTRCDTASLHWVNKDRKQFVLEASCSRLEQAMFQDRVQFENSYLEDYQDLTEPIQLEVGVHLQAEQLTHYYKETPVRFLNVLPFMNRGETVALTVLESTDSTITSEDEEAVVSYTNALGNLLYTFLELSDLSVNESQWAEYDEMLDQVNSRDDHALLLDNVMSQLQGFLHKGGVSMLCRGADGWRVVLNSAYSANAPAIGSVLHENTIAYEALKSGKPEFSIHFNGNPRRVSTSEPISQGASLAIPMLLHDRRQAVFVVYDENPLLFKESIKHKLSNLVRVASLKMMASRESYKVNADFMANFTGAFTAPILERTIYRQLKRARLFPDEHTWVAMFSCDEINTLRTRYGMEDLADIQKQVVRKSVMQGEQTSGIIGFHADYIYTAVIQSSREDGIDDWLAHMLLQQEKPYECSEDEIKLSFRVGYTRLSSEASDVYQVLKSIKTAFSDASRSSKFSVEV